jgi:hypothetical protein
MSQNNEGHDRGSPPSTPRWVKAFIIGFIILILLFVILHLLGLGFDGGHSLLIEHAVQL